MSTPDALFDSPYIRHERALEHLNEIRKALQRLHAEYANGVPAYFHPASRQHAFKEPLKRPQIEVIVRSGELLYNLRAALDHFTYALAFNHSGEINEKAQFPIEHKPEAFEGRRETYLKGIRNESIAFFKCYQPCHGCDWTARFVMLSNHDKHRDLRWMVSTFDPDTGIFERRPIAETPSGAFQFGAFDPAAFDTGAVDVNLRGTLNVTFEEGSFDVIETLEECVTEVGQLLDRGRGEFIPRS